MSPAVCPNGHTSATDDFCDVCGAPIGAGAGTSVPASAPAEPSPLSSASSASPDPSLAAPATGGAPKPCPNCNAQNAADALFCEDCGYDFATGQLPPPPSSTIDPSSGLLIPPTGVPSNTAAPMGQAPDLAGVDWVAEIWVDQDWFNSQQADGTCPTSGLPTVVALAKETALIGRHSKSRAVDPDIDCSADGAISHSHAQLDRDGDRWSVKDLGSTNGTYVGRPDGTYPTDPLPAQQAHQLADDERVYLGAWTRIVVRKATDQEKAGSST